MQDKLATGARDPLVLGDCRCLVVDGSAMSAYMTRALGLLLVVAQLMRVNRIYSTRALSWMLMGWRLRV